MEIIFFYGFWLWFYCNKLVFSSKLLSGVFFVLRPSGLQPDEQQLRGLHAVVVSIFRLWWPHRVRPLGGQHPDKLAAGRYSWGRLCQLSTRWLTDFFRSFCQNNAWNILIDCNRVIYDHFMTLEPFRMCDEKNFGVSELCDLDLRYHSRIASKVFEN